MKSSAYLHEHAWKMVGVFGRTGSRVTADRNTCPLLNTKWAIRRWRLRLTAVWVAILGQPLRADQV
jgi:hypothetical protein